MFKCNILNTVAKNRAEKRFLSYRDKIGVILCVDLQDMMCTYFNVLNFFVYLCVNCQALSLTGGGICCTLLFY